MACKIIIVGALGRMGREIGQLVLSDPSLELAGCVEIENHPLLRKDYGSLLGHGQISVPVSSSLDDISCEDAVIVNFALPDAIPSFLECIAGKKTRLVIGTTGLSENVNARIGEIATELPTVMSPNMSLGINLLFHLTELAAGRLKDEFDIEIIEAHHRHKKDSPSGTARRLGEIAARALDVSFDDAVRHGRSGMVGKRTGKEIGMHAVRGGEIVGDHTVLFAGACEKIELRHMAQNRAALARGALYAAKWLAQKGPGLYSMRDVLEL
ncbi:MAG: 4-hydroxy-tetrahydrodipicolinate reductase [Chitinivibrionales bacterium]|nr:4-hydroxy-tetrahydrodipicolinate reductase [Chitinivibrionales bacterium]